MLIRLQINHFLFIKNVDLHFQNGLTVLTGETGSGKSILFKTISLLFGERLDSEITQHSTIQGVFHANNHLDILLNDYNIPIKDHLTITRIITKNGKSKSFVNNKKVATRFLKNIAPFLGTVCGQFDGYHLIHKNHRIFLDTKNNESLSKQYHEWMNAQKMLLDTEFNLQRIEQDQQFTQNAIQEIAQAMQMEEEKILEKKLFLYNNHSKLYGALQEAQMSIREAGNYITKASLLIERLSDSLRPKELFQKLETIRIEIEEIKFPELQKNNIEEDINLIEDNLYYLRKIKKKYKISSSFKEAYDLFQKELEQLQKKENSITKLKQLVQKTKKIYMENAQLLSQKRKKQAALLESEMNKQLTILQLEESQFHVQITESHPSPYGIDQVNFFLSTLKNKMLLPLTRVSGGELSRVLLALHLCSPKNNGFIIFDEIESGTGGATAAAIGECLWKVSRKTGQVFAITHSPQVAAKADHHILITKKNQEACYQILDSQERVEEIARMLSGKTITIQAREAAQAMIHGS